MALPHRCGAVDLMPAGPFMWNLGNARREGERYPQRPHWTEETMRQHVEMGLDPAGMPRRHCRRSAKRLTLPPRILRATVKGVAQTGRHS